MVEANRGRRRDGLAVILSPSSHSPPHPSQGTQGVIVVVDSADADRFSAVGEEIRRATADDQLADARFLVLANKQDQPRATKPSALAKALKLEDIFAAGDGKAGSKYNVFPVSAETGEGLEAAVDWLCSQMQPL